MQPIYKTWETQGCVVCGAYDPADGMLLAEEVVPLEPVAERLYGVDGAIELAGELGYRPSPSLEGRRKRKRRRKKRRAKIKGAVKKAAKKTVSVAKKIAKSKVVKKIGKLAIAAASLVPGGQAVTAAYAAAKVAAKVGKKLKKDAKKGSVKAKTTLALVDATKRVAAAPASAAAKQALAVAKSRARAVGVPTDGDIAGAVLKDLAGNLVTVHVGQGKGKKPAVYAFRREAGKLVPV